MKIAKLAARLGAITLAGVAFVGCSVEDLQVAERLGAAGGTTGGIAGDGGTAAGNQSSSVGAAGGAGKAAGGAGASDTACSGSATRSCAVDGSKGNCAKGTERCLGGAWSPCSIFPAAADSCSIGGDDADCNGVANEGCVCIESMTRSCDAAGLFGNCASGAETCAAGKWGPCSIAPLAADGCATISDDANCNGTPNEGCSCITGSAQPCGPANTQGICKQGTQTCIANAWGNCEGATFPAPRSCASPLDNDCDGHPDNTIDATCQCTVGQGVACGAHAGADGKGPCKAGTQVCAAGANGTTSSLGACKGAVGPAAADSCDRGNDSNCNGKPNDGCTCINGATASCSAALGAKGPCAGGTTTCSNGKWDACSVPAATNDSCVSGNDDNCDGAANEGCRYITASTSVGDTAYDTTTGLTWRRLSADTTYSWNIANLDCPGGSSYWRLPTATELLGIVDKSQSPTIDNAIFPNTIATEYWTTTYYPGSSTVLFVVSFQDGGEHTNSTSVSLHMRCVH